MKKKNLFNLLVIIMAVILSFPFAACSDNNDEEAIEADTSKSEAKMFIGTWGGYGTWIFNEDGTCWYIYDALHIGNWSYNTETKTLITNILSWNWEILNITENSWTGTHLANKSSTITYTRIEL